jgi:hypothetical protein
LAIWRLKYLYEIFQPGLTAVILLNFCAINPPHCKSENRYEADKKTTMKQIIYIFSILIFGQPCFGQERSFYVPKYGNGDTTLWFNWQQEKFKKAGLKNLTKSTDTLHFRFASETQAVDIWTRDYLAFSGTLTNFTTSHDEKIDDRKKEIFYSEVVKLDTAKSREIFDLFMDKSVLRLAPQDSINGWKDGLDGITYFIEYSTPTFYSFKDYWTPSAFKDKVDAAKRFNELTEELERLLDLRNSFNKFIHSLPYRTYRAGGIMIITTLDNK